MKQKTILAVLVILFGAISFSFKNTANTELYESMYDARIHALDASLGQLLTKAKTANLAIDTDVLQLQNAILDSRKELKKADFWLRYLEPLAYKKINGPLPVEWETEVFEKFEKPYKREGAGLTLAALYLEEKDINNDSLAKLIQASIDAVHIYKEDSITGAVKTFSNFYFCNRLYLLNLASVYTTGFECPNTDVIIDELEIMMRSVSEIYNTYNESFAATALSASYMALHQKAIEFVKAQPKDYNRFNHFLFIKEYVNPLYSLNQQLMLQYRAVSKSTMDYALNKQAKSIFDKTLYEGQSSKGVYYNVLDEEALVSIDKLGKQLFYDPILSGNNERSCASCHKPTEFFADTIKATSFQFNHSGFLARNTPSLLNVGYNHLVMMDGAHISLQDQTRAVLLNPLEMGANEKDIMEKVLSCDEYKKGFEKLLEYTPQEPVLKFDHILSALTFYYNKFSKANAPFDRAMNNNKPLSADATEGFNLFMSKAQCATCHFVPQFNGVKPPFIGSEFEVLGTPATKEYKTLSADKGRYGINPATETMNAFRTGSLRNSMRTAPYMHNGVFRTMNEVIDFYDGGGGAGHGLSVPNQTLSSDSLRLSTKEKIQLIAFISSLTEDIPFEETPKKLPKSSNVVLNKRTVGGVY